MYSGKTTYLLNKLNTFAISGAKCLYVNSTLDTRGGAFSTHNPLISSIGNIASVKLSRLASVLERVDEYDIIAIDEAGFFEELKEIVLQLVETYGKRVYVGGLSGDYLRRPLGEILELIPYADSVHKLSAVCTRCAEEKIMSEAHFSYRVVNREETILIGNQESYIPLCRKCYLR
jgi:thymidine kinase